MKTIVAPSLLSSDFANLSNEIKKVTEAGADWLHVDVMDGHFVKNITIGPPVVASIKKASTLPLDVHLMIEKPENFIEAFAKAGADILTIHVESTQNPKKVIEQIRAHNVKPGVTLRPKTPIKELDPYLGIVDLVLIMTVEPGFGGQNFLHDQVEKIKYVKEHSRPDLWVEVDGGINNETAQICKDAGANVLVAGSYIFGNNYGTAIENLR